MILAMGETLRGWIGTIGFFIVWGAAAWDLILFSRNRVGSPLFIRLGRIVGPADCNVVPALSLGFIVGALALHFLGWAI